MIGGDGDGRAEQRRGQGRSLTGEAARPHRHACTIGAVSAGNGRGPEEETMCGRITQQLSQDQIGELYGVRGTPLPAAGGWLVRVAAEGKRQAALLPDPEGQLAAVVGRAVEALGSGRRSPARPSSSLPRWPPLALRTFTTGSRRSSTPDGSAAGSTRGRRCRRCTSCCGNPMTAPLRGAPSAPA